MNVMSLRLSPEEQKHLMRWAKEEKKDKSQAARELMEYGWKFAFLERYRQGKISLEILAKELKLSVLEAMDFLGEHGAATALDYDTYLQGLENLRKSW